MARDSKPLCFLPNRDTDPDTNERTDGTGSVHESTTASAKGPSMITPRNGSTRPDERKLGPEIINGFERGGRAEERIWAEGYTRHELDQAQETFGLTFPPDLIALFLERRPVQGYDWRSDGEKIRKLLAWPLRGLIFDVEHNDLWWPQWGERPVTAETRAEVLRDVVDQAPKVVPLFSHRYLPCEPDESGNPIFSVYQSDVIYYGANLADYFEREFATERGPLVGPVRWIRFWSDLVENYSCAISTICKTA